MLKSSFYWLIKGNKLKSLVAILNDAFIISIIYLYRKAV